MSDWRTDPDVITHGLIALVIAVMLACGIRHDIQHAAFLKAHGCHLLTEAPTGRQVYCGKVCFRPEQVYVYECADGTRTEVR